MNYKYIIFCLKCLVLSYLVVIMVHFVHYVIFYDQREEVASALKEHIGISYNKLRHMESESDASRIKSVGIRETSNSSAEIDVAVETGHLSYIKAMEAFRTDISYEAVCEYNATRLKTKDMTDESTYTVDHTVFETSDIMSIPALPYLPNYRSPCFYQNQFGSKKLNCLPYFFVAGFPKCGTTDFYHKLKLHPLIATPNGKEPLYFSLALTSDSKSNDFSRYLSHFTQASAAMQKKSDGIHGEFQPKVLGDFSTRELMMEFNTWKRNKSMTYDLIKHLLPCSKFIVLIRDPVERLYSDFIYFLKRQPEMISAETFHDRVTSMIQWWKKCTRLLSLQQCLYGSPEVPGLQPLFQGPIYKCWLPGQICPNFRIGFYSYILKDWMEHFPKESFLILTMEAFSESPVDVIQKQVLPFLGLPPMGVDLVDEIRDMERAYPFDSGPSGNVRKTFEDQNIVTPMLEKTREALEELYKDSNNKLASLQA